ncbi:hypothetical protein N7478_001301 [Penicillium angulare]|uniref:uncharacterized protein n=1 Tax=Penicillium angulare TaxID=116970 RepID=UPI0025424F64|nr:uncharacterized protein N7478_001301 [Penicillium angulare]KAJ5292050.1 hypothetical protein N7478_001301 [Penicillium angulare]
MADERSSFKRRRLLANATLSKPFKSPLRKPDLTEPTSESTSLKPALSTPPKNISHFNSPETPIDENQKQLTPPAGPPAIVLDRPPRIHPMRTPTRSSPANPEILSLTKQHRSCQSRLNTLHSELDNARQALRIESSGKEAELEALIVKWRLVAQTAADEVFATSQERVARMGGMAGWRERSKRDTMQWEYEEPQRQHDAADMEGTDAAGYNSSNPKNCAGFHEEEDQSEASLTS